MPLFVFFLEQMGFFLHLSRFSFQKKRKMQKKQREEKSIFLT